MTDRRGLFARFLDLIGTSQTDPFVSDDETQGETAEGEDDRDETT